MLIRKECSKRMSKIVMHNNTVYLCGQTGGIEGSVTDQMHECLRRVDELLIQANSSRNHILSTIIWLSDMVDFDRMNEVWDAWIPEKHSPARACGSAQLARPGLKVEVIVTAATIANKYPVI